MTGVQTCALPICFPVTIGGGFSVSKNENEGRVRLLSIFAVEPKARSLCAEVFGSDVSKTDFALLR